MRSRIFLPAKKSVRRGPRPPVVRSIGRSGRWGRQTPRPRTSTRRRSPRTSSPSCTPSARSATVPARPAPSACSATTTPSSGSNSASRRSPPDGCRRRRSTATLISWGRSRRLPSKSPCCGSGWRPASRRATPATLQSSSRYPTPRSSRRTSGPPTSSSNSRSSPSWDRTATMSTATSCFRSIATRICGSARSSSCPATARSCTTRWLATCRGRRPSKPCGSMAAATASAIPTTGQAAFKIRTASGFACRPFAKTGSRGPRS